MTPVHTAALVGKFIEEARDRIKALTDSLMHLEESPDADEMLVVLLRQCHSLKGSALMLGLADVAQLTHQMEELFVAVRRLRCELNPHAFDVIFGAVDRLSARIERLARGEYAPQGFEDVCRELTELIPMAEPPPVAAKTERERGPADSTDDDRPKYSESLRVPLEKLDGLSSLAAQMVMESLKASDRHTELRRVDVALNRLRERMRQARAASNASGRWEDADAAVYAASLDAIGRDLRDLLIGFSDDRVRLDRISGELRQTVIELTMVPLATVFDAFPRAVRDLARSFGKPVELSLGGRDTEIDKKVIEQISEPLIHLIRNAVDHGLEMPEERVRLGKPAAGQLHIWAEQRDNRILVGVRDDGRGIDLNEIRATAIRQGIAAEAEVRQWPREQVLDLIFTPGFSTRSSATDVSGRGFGMDVVKSVVTRLGGGVRVTSEPGRGTTTILDLPVSLALLTVILIECGGELYAIPAAAVRRTVRLTPGEISQLQQDSIAEIDNEPIALVSLNALLGVRPAPAGSMPVALIAEAGDNRLGLLIDAVIEERELVFKELRGPLGTQRTFAGAALLGDGDIVPILNVHTLFELAARAPSRPVLAAPEPRPTVRSRVLVVEDSIVAGELQRNILQASGYDAVIAHDAFEALDMLRREDWSLVVSDVDMPRMDGFELTAQVRADKRLHDIPVMIVTSRDSADERRRGFESGADAYLVKQEFDQTRFLETIERLIGRPGPDEVVPAPSHGNGETHV